MIEYTALELFIQEIQDELPHGSGIDWDWTSHYREITDGCGVGVAIFYDYYEQDAGFGAAAPLPFAALYRFNLNTRTVQFRDIVCNATEQLVQDEEGEFDGLDNTLDYLYQCFNDTKVKL